MKADAKISHMAQLTPQDDYIKTALRLPRDVHAQIQQAATASGRSMNAEIVARLQGSLDSSVSTQASTSELPRLYVLLDSNGYPLSWSEIREHLKAIREAGKLNVVEMETYVVTPDMESNSRRNEAVVKLAAYYRKQGKSGEITD